LHIATLRLLLDPSIFALTPDNLFWPYFSGLVVLAAGLFTTRKEIAGARGVTEKLFVLAPIFFATTMAVFGSQHFTAAKGVATIVPAFYPFPLFWTLLVGVALEATALSLATKKYAQLAATLFAAMMIVFILTMHIPNIIADPKNILRWATPFRDLTFCGGALAFAAMQTKSWRAGIRPTLVTVARIFIGAAAIFFGVSHFARPEFLPAVDFDQLTPLWLPAHTLWSYFAAAVFLAAGLALIANQKSRQAAQALSYMGLTILVFVFLPLMIWKISDIALGLNYFVSTLAFSASALMLTQSLTQDQWTSEIMAANSKSGK
jgi:uncharacterized membrane protein